MSELIRRLRYLLNRRRLDSELAADLDFHREMAARAGNRVPLGNALHLREESREAWGWIWIERLGQDLRYAFRKLRKSPSFTLAAVTMLAVGIGVNVAAFGFFNLMLFKPLPVLDPDTLVRFKRSAPGNFASELPYPVVDFYRRHARTLTAVLALHAAHAAHEDDPKPVNIHFVTANYFSELGAPMRYGRRLEPETEGAVLSYAFWQRRYGSDPAITGRVIRVNRKPVTVAGVASDQFSGLTMTPPDLWMPIEQHAAVIQGSPLLTDLSGVNTVRMFGRLGPGVSPKIAEDELRGLAAQYRREQPDVIWEGETLPAEAAGYLQDGATHRSSAPPPTLRSQMLPVFGLVTALVALILTVACGNLGSLLLARGVARSREIAIRVAVGAGSGRLVRQLLTESLVLALAGSAAGLALGAMILRALMAWTGAPSWIDPTPDWRVILFAFAIGLFAALVFGLSPALQLARQKHRAGALRHVLIGAQVAGSCVLLIVAGLLVRALNRATAGDPGFDHANVITVDPALSGHGYAPGAAKAYLDSLGGRLRALPGVESVAFSCTPPLGGRRVSASEKVDGRTFEVFIHPTDPDFLHLMRIPLLRGRNLTAAEPRGVVVSESFALRKWPGENPLGKPFPFGGKTYTVTGLSGSARTLALKDPSASEVYLLAESSDLPNMTAIVRTSGLPELAAPSIAAAAKAIAPGVQPVVRLMKEAFRESLRDAERSAAGAAVLGMTALLLACLGIVGLVTYAVSQRTQEIGIRMALGAKPSHVLSIVLRQFSRPVAAGLLIGIGGAAALAQLLRSELYGISGVDPVAYAAAIAVFVITIAIAALIPARRALRVDPLRALRYE